MKLSSSNEWGRLRSIVVGTATNANWPDTDPVFAREGSKTSWKESPVPAGRVPQWIVDETNEDLEGLVNILRKYDVEVIRPLDIDFPATNGMYNYCPRDRLIIAGDQIVDPAMMYPCRDQEIHALNAVTTNNNIITMPRNQDMVLDAANICRLGKDWLFLESASGNRKAHQWLSNQFPEINIELCNFYAGVHIDSTVIALREGLVLLNASRVKSTGIPKVLADWEIVWVNDCIARPFHKYPYASKWIGMNMLSIDPTTVIVDNLQKEIITTLEKLNFTVIPHQLRHSRTLGGGFHCVTLDLRRDNE
jgi:N-dimethylarginine dimethylaminohydrolase